MTELLDRLDRRCPRLGSMVSFRYCRTDCEGGAACPKVLDCWHERFDVVAFFRSRMPEEAFERLSMGHAKPKMVHLLELIEAARKNAASPPEKTGGPPALEKPRSGQE